VDLFNPYEWGMTIALCGKINDVLIKAHGEEH
jgi:hypothetical protein